MDAPTIVAFLTHLNAKHIQVRDPWVQCSCPLSPWTHDGGQDSSPSFAIRIEAQGESYFNCFVCQNGKLGDLVVSLQHYKAQTLGYDLGAAWSLVVVENSRALQLHIKEWGSRPPTRIDFPIPEWWLDEFQKVWPVPVAREYLQSRQVTEAVATILDIRWDRSAGTVCFPVRNRNGDLVSLRGRRIAPRPGQPPYHVYAFQKQQSGQAWLGEQSVDYSRPVLMVESVFDMTSVLRVYDNVMAPLSVGINAARMARVARASEVVTLFDRGAGGDKARAIVSRYLPTAFVVHRIPPEKDPGDCTIEQLRDTLQNVLPLQNVCT